MSWEVRNSEDLGPLTMPGIPAGKSRTLKTWDLLPYQLSQGSLRTWDVSPYQLAWESPGYLKRNLGFRRLQMFTSTWKFQGYPWKSRTWNWE